MSFKVIICTYFLPLLLLTHSVWGYTTTTPAPTPAPPTPGPPTPVGTPAPTPSAPTPGSPTPVGTPAPTPVLPTPAPTPVLPTPAPTPVLSTPDSDSVPTPVPTSVLIQQEVSLSTGVGTGSETVTIQVDDQYHPLEEVMIPGGSSTINSVIIIDTNPQGPAVAPIDDTELAPIYDWQNHEDNPADDSGSVAYEPIFGTGVNITIQDENGDSVEFLDQPISLLFEVPSEYDAEDVYLFMFDPDNQHWIEVSAFYNQSSSPRVNCRNNTARFEVQHLTQFNLFHRQLLRGEECYYKDCGDHGYCLRLSCQASIDELELETCHCLPGHQGDNCQLTLTADFRPWTIVRWIVFVAWTSVFMYLGWLVLSRWLIERNIDSYSHWDLLFKGDWQICWLIILGALFRVTWLGADPHTQSRSISPEADFLINGFYLPLSLILHSNVLYNWSVGVLNMEELVDKADILDSICKKAKYCGWLLFPISITGDILLSLNLNSATANAGSYISLVALALYLLVNIGLVIIGMIYLGKTWRIFTTFYKRGGRHNLITLVTIISCNSLLLAVIIIVNVVGFLLDDVLSFVSMFVLLEVGLMIEWLGMGQVIIRPTAARDFSNSSGSTSVSESSKNLRSQDSNRQLKKHHRSQRRIEAGLEKDITGSERRRDKRIAKEEAMAQKQNSDQHLQLQNQ